MGALQPRSTRGWWVIFGLAAAHNVWAAGSGREMLSEAARRHRRVHPVLVPAVALGLVAHLMGWLDHRVDPLYRLGEAVEVLTRLCRALWGRD